MARPDAGSASAKLLTLVTILVAVAGLYIGREVLIPLALAILLSFLLAPLVRRLERLGLWRLPSVLLAAILALAAVVVITYVMGGQLILLGDRLPQYRYSIHERMAAIRSGDSALGRAGRNIQEISKEFATSQTGAATPATDGVPAPATAPASAGATSAPSEPPVPVQVVGWPYQPLELVREALGSLLSPLLTAGIVVIFAIFILLQREDLRDRLISLAGEERMDVTTQALDDTAQRISRYLLMQATVNVSMGLLVALGLWLIGLPNALLWGLLAGTLRFIPYVGIWIAAAMPILLSLAIFPHGWLAPLAVLALFAGLEILVANVVEPLLYGGSTGISPLAVLVAAIFWAWLWGPLGLLLSTPLTVCLVVLGKYVPALSFLNVLLGDEPVLDPSSRFYQRLLAADQEEAEDLAEDRLESSPLVKIYDEILVPALRLAELDHHRGRLDNGRLAGMYQAVREIVENLHEREREIRPPLEEPTKMDAETPATGPPAPAEPEDKKSIQVLCLPARDEADQVVAEMLAQVLADNGIPSRATSASMLISEMLDEVAASQARIVCISAVPPEAMARTRHLCKRLKTRFPQAKTMVGFWDPQADPARIRARLLQAGADHVLTDFAGVLQVVRPSSTSDEVTT